jgi:glycosyltransferase 2 family protein
MRLPLKLAITVILVAAIVWQLGDLRKVGQLLVRIDPAYMLVIFAVYTLDRALMTHKWGLLLRSRGQQLPFFHGLRIYCASMVWGMFLPATVGSDAIRAFSTSRSGLDVDEVVASIFIERMIGFITALLLGLFGLALLFLAGGLEAHFRPLWWLGSVVLLVTTLAFATSFSHTAFDFLHGCLLQSLAGVRIIRRLRRFHQAYLAYRGEKRSLAAFFGLTVVQQLTPILPLWLVARALEIEASLLYIAGAVPLTFLISRIPVSIAGLGVFEGVFMLLMSLVGLTAAESIAIALTGRILEMASWLPWWLAHVIGYGELRPPPMAAKGG